MSPAATRRRGPGRSASSSRAALRARRCRTCAGVDVDDAVARLDGSFDTSVVEEGSETARAGSVLRQSPDPGTRAVLGSTVTLTVARAPEWGTTWSDSGSGSYDSEDIEVTAPQGKWRIVVDLHPRYLIFGSGSATVSWEGHGSGAASRSTPSARTRWRR